MTLAYVQPVPMLPDRIVWYWSNGSDALQLERLPRTWTKVLAAY